MIKWNTNYKLDNRRIELLKFGYSCQDVADILSDEFEQEISKKSVRNRCYITNTTKSALFLEKCSDAYIESLNEEEKNNEVVFPKDSYHEYKEYAGYTNTIESIKKIHKEINDINPKKILSLSDLHAPMMNFKAIEKAINDNLDADICVLNGDVLDCQSMSSFDKMKEIDLEIELSQVFTLLDVLSKKFKKVIWVGGNHDFRRFLSFIMKNFNDSMKNFAVKRLDPMKYIQEKYDNLIIIQHDWIQIGDVIFAHLQNFSTVEMKTVINCNDIFSAMNEDILPNINYKSVIIGHTHHIGKIIKNGKLLIEQGCLCHMQDYRFNKPTKLSWETGYAIVEFNNMKVDFNKTNFIVI